MDVLADASAAAAASDAQAAQILEMMFHQQPSATEDANDGGTASFDDDDVDEDGEATRPWTKDEDDLLRRLAMEKAGPQPASRRGVAKPPAPMLEMKAWREIAEEFDSDRTAQACAHRFQKVLSPDNIKGAPRRTYAAQY